MSHLCDSTVASPTARRDNVLASKCEYPPFRYPPFKCALKTGKSTPWTNTGQDWNFQRTLSAIGPYEFRGKLIWTNHWSIWISSEIRMDQIEWSWEFFESFSLDRYWSTDGSSQQNLARDDFCLSIVSQLPSQWGYFWKREKKHSLLGERQFGSHFRRLLGEGKSPCESKLSRDCGETIFAAGDQDVSQGPLDCTKNTTESGFGTGSQFATAVAKQYGECSEMRVFLRKQGRKRYGQSKVV